MIEVKHLTKKYGDFAAISDLSFHIDKGQIYGFLGPNGAGKSTTMNIMTGCLAATSGEVLIGGYDIFEQPKEAKRLIGYLPEIPPLYMEQTPFEYLTFVAMAKGIKGKKIEEEIDRVAEETHIEAVLDKLIRNLSKGYRQRVGIAQALIGNPEVIILDEPTVGLDPVQIIEIRELIRSLGSKHTVILSSHILPEIQAICQQVMIIYKGKLVAFDKPENLEVSASRNTIELEAECTKDELTDLLSGMTEISDIQFEEDADDTKDTEKKEEADTTAVLTVNRQDLKAECKKLFNLFAASGIALYKLNSKTASLEDIFLELTTESQKEAQAEKNEEEKASSKTTVADSAEKSESEAKEDAE